MGRKKSKKIEQTTPPFDRRGQHGPALWNGAFFTHQLRKPSSSNRPKRESSAALPESNVKRPRVASAASSSAPISRANGKGKDRANEGLKPCLPGFKRSSLSDPDVPTAQNVSNMASNPINIPNVEQPVINEALETPFGFAKSSTFTMKLFKKMGYEEGSGLGKDGQGIKEPIRVGIWTEKQGLGFKTAQTSEQNAGDQNGKQNQ